MSRAMTVFENDSAYTAEGILPELIESAFRAGEREVAATALETLSRRALAAATPWGLGLRARCAALLAEGAEAEDSYRESISQLERCQMAATWRALTCCTAMGCAGPGGGAAPGRSYAPRMTCSHG